MTATYSDSLGESTLDVCAGFSKDANRRANGLVFVEIQHVGSGL